MNRMNPFAAPLVLLSLVAGIPASALAAKPLAPAVVQIQDRWAQASYQTPKAARAQALQALATQAEQVRKAQPGDAAAWTWEGIVLSSLAGEKGGLGALGLVKQARADFEQALALDPQVMDGAAYTSLGALYYQVPGWPLGFGDDGKARELLRKGVAIDPQGIDSNYFLGDFLRDQKEWAGAAAAFEKAVQAPPRPGRQVADEGRRQEAQARLREAREQLAK